MDQVAFNMLCAQTNRIEEKVDNLSRRMSERDGERRVGLWLFGTASGAFGALLTFGMDYFLRRHP